MGVDGVAIGGGASSSGRSKQAPREQFYLSVERDKREEAKERGLDMEQYQLDLMPDDEGQIKSAKSVIRWDAKKKKYLPCMVAFCWAGVRKLLRLKQSTSAMMVTWKPKNERG